MENVVQGGLAHITLGLPPRLSIALSISKSNWKFLRVSKLENFS